MSTRDEILNAIADATGLSKADVKNLLDKSPGTICEFDDDLSALVARYVALKNKPEPNRSKSNGRAGSRAKSRGKARPE